MLALVFFAVLFEAPLTAAVVAGGAVSVPIIIHLLNRKRFKVVTWAAMRFLLAAQRKNSRRMRIEQILLLIVRCLVFALLVLAMASVTPWAEAMWRYFNPEGGKALAAGGQRTHKVIVVDGSFSMGTEVAESTAFERARDVAEKIVQAGASRDAFSVVLMASPARAIVAEPSEDARKVANEVKALRLTHGGADLRGTLATVANLLKSSPGKFPAREVYFVTDMQKSSWVSGRPGELDAALQGFQSARARAVFVDVGQDAGGNLAITNLELDEPIATNAGEVPIRAT